MPLQVAQKYRIKSCHCYLEICDVGSVLGFGLAWSILESNSECTPGDSGRA